MSIVTEVLAMHKPTVHYARLYAALDGYAIVTPTGATYFCDHDGHLYTLTPDQAHALTVLGAVPQIERANVLAVLAQAGEV